MTTVSCNIKERGQLLFASEPYVHILSGHQRGIRCDWCFAEKNDFSDETDDSLLPRCQACSVVHYCNISCQKQAWKLHKLECRCLKQVSPRKPTESVRLMLKLLVRKAQKDDINKRELLPGGKARKFVDLLSHTDYIQKDPKRLSEFTQLLQVLKTFTDGQIELPDKNTLLQLFGQLVINSFSICDAENRSIGVGLYLAASALNHSCTPNAVAVFRGTQVFIRGLDVDTKSDKQQITISYVDFLATRSERREQLSKYYFECNCSLCLDNSHDGLLVCSICPDDKCQGYVTKTHLDGKDLILQCEKCYTTDLKPDYQDKCLKLVEEVKSFVKTIQRSITKDSAGVLLNQCNQVLEKTERVLGDRNVYIVQILDTCYDCCILSECWEDALRYGERSLNAYDVLLPHFHPNKGVQMLRVGKLRLFLGKFLEAVQALEVAKEILIVTHGCDHQLLLTLQQLMMEAKMEVKKNYRSLE